MRFLALYSRCPPEAVGLFHEYFLREKSAESIAALVKGLREKDLLTGDQAAEVRRFARLLPDHPVLAGLVIDIFEKAKSPAEADDVLPACIPAASKDLLAFLEGLLERGLPPERRVLVEAVRAAARWKLASAGGSQGVVEGWIRMLDEQKDVYEVQEWLVLELVRATPRERQAEVCEALRKRAEQLPSSDLVRALVALGARLSTEEKLIGDDLGITE